MVDLILGVAVVAALVSLGYLWLIAPLQQAQERTLELAARARRAEPDAEHRTRTRASA
jgi:hypothetical protein